MRLCVIHPLEEAEGLFLIALRLRLGVSIAVQELFGEPPEVAVAGLSGLACFTVLLGIVGSTFEPTVFSHQVEERACK